MATIIHKKGRGVPTAESLSVGEIAIDTYSGVTYTKLTNGTVVEIGGGSGTGAGMVISPTEPVDPVDGLQWLDSTTARVWVWDENKWLEFPAAGGSAEGSGLIEVSEEPPEPPYEIGQQWFSSTDGYLYIWYGSEWVAIGGAGGGGEDLLDDTGNLAIDGNVDAVTTTGRIEEVGSVDSLTVINCSLSNNFMTTLSEDTAFSFTQVPSKELSGARRFIEITNTFYELELWIQQDADASGHSVSWPSSIKWPDDKEPTLSTEANSVSVIGLSTADGGSTWFGRLLSGGFSGGGDGGDGPLGNQILIVAGGGAGGNSRERFYNSGGGGAGGVIYLTKLDDNYFATGVTIDVTVGVGGGVGGSQAAGGSGTNSSIKHSGEAEARIAAGGGGGGGNNAGPSDGGSGGGTGSNQGTSGGQGNTLGSNPPQGYDGNNWGGGGAGGNGYEEQGDFIYNHPQNGPQYWAGKAGPGILSEITGSPQFYAAGGGTGGNVGMAGTGGTGTGAAILVADGVNHTGINAKAGRDGYGDGGGGGTHQPAGNQTGAKGGNGVVIIRSPKPAVSTTGSPQMTTDGSHRIYKFLVDGSLTF